ncbi:DNA topoisomerase, partial [Vibrio parahaemolyticus]
QEAHEAIRPTHVERTPDSIRRYLSDDQAKLYELIWKRAVASQMKHAKLLRTEVAIGVQAEDRKLTFQTSGKQVLFDGFLRLYSTATD